MVSITRVFISLLCYSIPSHSLPTPSLEAPSKTINLFFLTFFITHNYHSIAPMPGRLPLGTIYLSNANDLNIVTGESVNTKPAPIDSEASLKTHTIASNYGPRTRCEGGDNKSHIPPNSKAPLPPPRALDMSSSPSGAVTGEGALVLLDQCKENIGMPAVPASDCAPLLNRLDSNESNPSSTKAFSIDVVGEMCEREGDNANGFEADLDMFQFNPSEGLESPLPTGSRCHNSQHCSPLDVSLTDDFPFHFGVSLPPSPTALQPLDGAGVAPPFGDSLPASPTISRGLEEEGSAPTSKDHFPHGICTSDFQHDICAVDMNLPALGMFSSADAIAPSFDVGSLLMGKYAGYRNAWYPCTVLNVLPDDKYEVQFTSGIERIQIVGVKELMKADERGEGGPVEPRHHSSNNYEENFISTSAIDPTTTTTVKTPVLVRPQRRVGSSGRGSRDRDASLMPPPSSASTKSRPRRASNGNNTPLKYGGGDVTTTTTTPSPRSLQSPLIGLGLGLGLGSEPAADPLSLSPSPPLHLSLPLMSNVAHIVAKLLSGNRRIAAKDVCQIPGCSNFKDILCKSCSLEFCYSHLKGKQCPSCCVTSFDDAANVRRSALKRKRGEASLT
jgi:hypothetical protein